jgi:hypothetical protein
VPFLQAVLAVPHFNEYLNIYFQINTTFERKENLLGEKSFKIFLSLPLMLQIKS